MTLRREVPGEHADAVFIAPPRPMNTEVLSLIAARRRREVAEPGDRLHRAAPRAGAGSCLVLKDGSMLVSDDHAGAIYRISYGK